MRQTIQRLVESPLADEILAGRVRAGEKLLAEGGVKVWFVWQDKPSVAWRWE